MSKDKHTKKQNILEERPGESKSIIVGCSSLTIHYRKKNAESCRKKFFDFFPTYVMQLIKSSLSNAQ